MSDRRKVPLEEALRRIGDSERIHTQKNPAPGLFLGADWDRADVVALIEEHGCEDAGPNACAQGHTLWVDDGSPRGIFIEADPAEV